jgi:hypothetical protein
MIWTTAYILAKVRKLTGRPSQGQITDTELLALVNEYFLTTFPIDCNLTVDNKDWVITTTGADSGVYNWDTGIQVVKPLVYCESSPLQVEEFELNVYFSREVFISLWPDAPWTTITAGQPQDALIDIEKRTLTVMPPPDGVYTLTVEAEYDPVTPLDLASINPDLESWGPVIAWGSAILLHATKGEQELADGLVNMYNYYKTLLTRTTIKNLANSRTIPTF